MKLDGFRGYGYGVLVVSPYFSLQFSWFTPFPSAHSLQALFRLCCLFLPCSQTSGEELCVPAHR